MSNGNYELEVRVSSENCISIEFFSQILFSRISFSNRGEESRIFNSWNNAAFILPQAQNKIHGFDILIIYY